MSTPAGTERRRLVLIAPFACTPKSTTRLRVLPLARALAADGKWGHVTVLVPPYDNPQEGGQTFRSGRATVVALPVDRSLREQSWRQAIAQPRLAVALARGALALRPDVVHVFKPKAVSGLTQTLLWYRRKMGGLTGRLTGGAHRNYPDTRTRRGPGRPGPALVLDTDDWEGNGGWNEYERYPWWQKWACDRQERWGLEHADAITVASRTLQAQAWAHGARPDCVRYLPNGFDPVDYDWATTDGREARERLGLLGRPVALLYTRFFEFSPERALHVMARLRAEVPDATLLVVGAGKFGQERRLAAMAQAGGMGDSLRLAGWQPPEALPGLLAAGDIALFPADDNLANRAKCSVKVLEMMWLGVPVVADRVGQYAEYVQDSVTGLLSNPDDSAGMAAAAARLLRDRFQAEQLAAAARRRVAEKFNWPRLAVAAEHAYAAALDKRGRSDE